MQEFSPSRSLQASRRQLTSMRTSRRRECYIAQCLQEFNPRDTSKPAAKLWRNELDASDDEDDRPSRADISYM